MAELGRLWSWLQEAEMRLVRVAEKSRQWSWCGGSEAQEKVLQRSREENIQKHTNNLQQSRA